LVRTCAAVAAICLVSSAAVAQDAAQPQAAAPAKEKKVCRSVATTGSIMAKRMCLTKSEWAELNARNERHNDMFRDNKNKGLKPDTL
jgi:opacity protein-like surface antigen